jgi:pyridoxamine 5'-phosphate oxidase
MTEQEWQKQDPLQLFSAWLKEAKECTAIREPTAMAVATNCPSLGLSNRIVLLKSFSAEGFVFFTNYDSSKGKSLDEQPEAAAVFYWDALAKQVRLVGSVSKTTRAESEKYWNSRARESQLSQYISKQSDPVADRATLEKLVKDADQKFRDQSVPCPENWGGYVLKPQQIEFWQARPGRLHDRFVFTVANRDWTSRRLYP